MFNPKTSYAKIAFDAVLFYVTTSQIKKDPLNKVSDDLKLKRACIVSIYDKNGDLRSNYGKLNPENETLYEEIIENAIKAVTEGGEKQIDAGELNSLKVSVEVLSALHKLENFNEIKPKKHGVYVTDKEGHSGYIMPNTKGITTVEKQLEKAKLNAEINGVDNVNLEFYYFKSTQYD